MARANDRIPARAERVRPRQGPARPAPLPLPRPPPSFRGRSAELRRLEALLRRYRGVAVCGLGGMGKTALALAAAHAARPTFAAIAYEPIRDGDDFAAVADRLLAALRPRAAVRLARGRAGAARALAAALAARPTLVVLDDLHRLAAPDLAALERDLAPVAGDSRLLATSRRDAFAAGGEFAVLRISPLSRTEARALYRDLAGRDDPPAAVDRGVPLEIRQLAAKGGGTHRGAAIDALIDEVDPADRAWLERLALVGPAADPAAAGAPNDVLTRLRRACLLEPPRAALAMHEAVREAVLGGPPERLAVRRQEAIDLLARSPDPEALRRRVALAVEARDDAAALGALDDLAQAVGFRRIGRGALAGAMDRRDLEAVPRTRAAVAAAEVLAAPGGTPESVAALAPPAPGRSPEDDALLLLLGYGERAAAVDRQLASAKKSPLSWLGAAAPLVFLAQRRDARTGGAIARCRARVDLARPALGADLLSLVAWAQRFQDSAAACTTLELALPLARAAGDLCGVTEVVTDLALARLDLGHLAAARERLAAELPVWRRAVPEDPVAVGILLHSATATAAGDVAGDRGDAARLAESPALSPLMRCQAAGRAAQLAWLAGDYDAAARQVGLAVSEPADRRATAGFAAVDALILLGRFGEAWERTLAITKTRTEFRAVREAQLAFYGLDRAAAIDAAGRAADLFAGTRAAIDAVRCRLHLADGRRDAARATAQSLLEWGVAEVSPAAQLEAHAVLAAVGDEAPGRLAAIASLGRGRGGLCDRARAFATALAGRPAGREAWLADLAAGRAPDGGPRLPMALDALALVGRLPSKRPALVFGERRPAEAREAAGAAIAYDAVRRELVVGGERVDLAANARPRAALEALAEASPEWIETARLFERVFALRYLPARANALHAVIKRLRKLLGPAAGAIESSRGRYRFDGRTAVVLFAPGEGTG